MLNELLRKLAKRFAGKPLFEYPVVKQKAYIDIFREPRSNIERSFCQYKAQMKLKGFWIGLAMTLVSPFLLLWYLIKPSQKPCKEKMAEAVFIMDGNVSDNVIPLCLRDEFEKLELYHYENNLLKWTDRKYIFRLWLKYPFSWHFVLKSAIKIMRYRWVIESYSPKALIVHNEFSFTSSMLTDYCNKNGIELINVMHGEKLFNMRDSFFKFNRCYIWNEFYKELFEELRADPSQFIVAVPPSLMFGKKEVLKSVDYTYYLQAQKGENLKFIVEMLVKLQEKGNNIAVRPHPRYTDIAELKSYIADNDIEIESVREMPIEVSVLRTRNVISVYSTVLQQAYYNNVQIVVDDLSDPVLFNKLKSYKYVMFKINDRFVSNLINEN